MSWFSGGHSFGASASGRPMLVLGRARAPSRGGMELSPASCRAQSGRSALGLTARLREPGRAGTHGAGESQHLWGARGTPPCALRTLTGSSWQL